MGKLSDQTVSYLQTQVQFRGVLVGNNIESHTTGEHLYWCAGGNDKRISEKASQKMNSVNSMRMSSVANAAGDAQTPIPIPEKIPFIKIAQANLERPKDATSEMYSLVQEQRLDVLLIQEPYARATGTSYIVGGLGIAT
ncbi:hypothetical protein PV326_007205 [Microctonus aethiopoides]|nr:hypothetical protein PV326_007205 [Microctonus aethiopoides]